MSIEVRVADGSQSVEPVAQPRMESVTPEERLLLRFFRLLDDAEQGFMHRAIEALVQMKRQR